MKDTKTKKNELARCFSTLERFEFSQGYDTLHTLILLSFTKKDHLNGSSSLELIRETDVETKLLYLKPMNKKNVAVEA